MHSLPDSLSRGASAFVNQNSRKDNLQKYKTAQADQNTYGKNHQALQNQLGPGHIQPPSASPPPCLAFLHGFYLFKRRLDFQVAPSLVGQGDTPSDIRPSRPTNRPIVREAASDAGQPGRDGNLSIGWLNAIFHYMAGNGLVKEIKPAAV
jgi:hypothetical protein